ncbi:MAG: hypothetical protein BEN19_07425 [Epulopiscium sp. Nuni2H_MBin003]|nr:MAG: hypothetical protein BEN19_07425 [Epulopiscium sp. Nuni2H_MBin003]
MEKYLDEAVKIRELIHMYPEGGFNEVRTAKIVADTLRNLGITVTENVAKTGVIGLLRGAKPGKTILLRADMDALQLQELADVPYKSKIDSMMHACGHDGHTAGLLGTAMILSEHKDEICGNIKFMFQPAEETTGGALPMIKEGILENPKVDAAVSGHLWGSIKSGEVHVKAGATMASPNIFTIRIIGKGGHCAIPHQAIDAILVASEVICSLQSVVSRMTNPLEPIVLSIGQIHAGHCFNVIPNEVFIEGTVRVLERDSASRIKNQMEQIISGITKAYGATYEFKFDTIFPPVINDEKMAELVQASARKVVGKDKVFTLSEPSMGGEDFSYLGENVPSAFFFVGIAEEQVLIHHNPYFCWDSKICFELSKCLAQITLDYLNGKEI